MCVERHGNNLRIIFLEYAMWSLKKAQKKLNFSYPRGKERGRFWIFRSLFMLGQIWIFCKFKKFKTILTFFSYKIIPALISKKLFPHFLNFNPSIPLILTDNIRAWKGLCKNAIRRHLTQISFLKIFLN